MQNATQIFHDVWVQIEQLCQRLATEPDPMRREELEGQRCRFESILERAPAVSIQEGGEPHETPGEDLEAAWQQLVTESAGRLAAIP